MSNLLTPTYLAYLARYFLAVCYILAIVILVRQAVRALKFRINSHLKPANGYFLLAVSSRDPELAQSFKLYHTTLIGSNKSADIRIRDKSIWSRHALVYLYDGYWYIRQASAKAKVSVNNRALHEPRRLKNEDQIGLGEHIFFSFIDERSAARKAGFEYEGSWAEREAGYNYELPVRSSNSFALIMFFYLCGVATVSMLHYQNDLKDLLPLSLGLLGGFALIASLGYLVWPILVRNFDQPLYVGFLMLGTIGLIAQARYAFIGRIKPDDWSMAEMLSYVRRDFLVQALVAIVGLLLLPIIVKIVTQTRWLELIAPACLVITPTLYLITFVLGRGGAEWGAGLWIRLPGGLSIQLTEFAKISYLIVLGLFFKNRPTFKIQCFFALWACLNFGLIMILPDLGSMMILLPVTLLVYFMMTSEYIKTASILLAGSGIVLVAYQIMGYVQRRINGWLTLWTEVNANNEQIIRALQAMGRGGLFGRGIGHGNPRSIPLFSSDMVFGAICEEFGLVLCLGIVLVFIFIWLRGATAVPGVRDGFTSSLILATSSYFFIEAAVVIGGVTGLIPLTGATLPFIAKGGSSMLAKWLMAGLLLGLYGRRERGAYAVSDAKIGRVSKRLFASRRKQVRSRQG